MPTDVETEKRRRGIAVLLVLAPMLIIVGAIITGLTELGASLYSPPPAWFLGVAGVTGVVISLLSPVQLLAAGIIQIRRGIRTGLSWAAVWVGASLILLGLLSTLGLVLVLLSHL